MIKVNDGDSSPKVVELVNGTQSIKYFPDVKFIGQHLPAETKIKTPITHQTLPDLLQIEKIHHYEFQVANETEKLNDLMMAVNEGNPHFSPFIDHTHMILLETNYA